MEVALEFFLIPNSVLDGGITGISIIIQYLTGWPLGALLFVLNLPFIIIGYKQIGKTFAFSATYGIAIMSAFTQLFHDVEPFTEDKILAVLFGALILGAGVGLVLRSGGALDGSEMVALLISKRFKLPVGQIILVFNIFIFIAAGFVYGEWETSLYSIFTFFIASKVMDIVVEGLNESKSVMIISGEYEEISDTINTRLGRSTTYMYARGGYSKNDTQVVYCVVTRLELAKLKAIVAEIDPKAFLAIEAVSDVQGGDFSKSSIH
jgi:uncharacterized membrane-anchored protein YitT (DUF2179 family)